MVIYNVAHKVTERLYGDDKVKCELIFYILNNAKRVFDAYGIMMNGGL